MAKLQSDLGRYGITPEWLLDTDISDRAIRLFSTLAAKYCDRDTQAAFPSRTTLAANLGCSTDSIDRAIKDLERVGALEVERRWVGKEQITSVYVIAYVQPPSRKAAATPPLTSGTEPESINQNQEPELLSSSTIVTEESADKPLTVQTVMDTLEGMRGYPSGKYGAEAKAVKQMITQGYTSQEMMDCYEHLLKDHFWEGKALLMNTVAGQIGAWKKVLVPTHYDTNYINQQLEDRLEGKAWGLDRQLKVGGLALTEKEVVFLNDWKRDHPGWTSDRDESEPEAWVDPKYQADYQRRWGNEG